MNARIISHVAESQGALDTQEITLSPELIAALRRIAPKRRRSKLPYVIGLALFTVAVVLGRSGATRGLMASWRHSSLSSGGSPAAPLAPVRNGELQTSAQGGVGAAASASAAITTTSPSSLEIATPPPAARVKSHRERTPRRGNAVRR